MALAFDAASNSGYQTAQSSYSWSHAIGSRGNPALVVGVSMLSVGGSSVSSVTFNGVSVTLLGARASISGAVRVELWGIDGVNSGFQIPENGTYTIAVTLSASLDSIASAVSFTGASSFAGSFEAENDDSQTNIGPTDASIDITTVDDNDWVVCAVATDDTAITANQTEQANVSGTLGSGGLSTTGPVSPAGVQTMSWTNVDALATWSIIGCGIKPIVATKVLLPSDPQNTTAGSILQNLLGNPVQPYAADASNNQISSYDANNFICSSSPSGVTGTLSRAGPGNILFNDLIINSAGSYTLTFASSGLTSATSSSFTITGGATASGSTLCMMGVG